MIVHSDLRPVCLGAIRYRVVYICSFKTSGTAAVTNHCLPHIRDVQQEEKWYQSYMRHLIL